MVSAAEEALRLFPSLCLCLSFCAYVCGCSSASASQRRLGEMDGSDGKVGVRDIVRFHLSSYAVFAAVDGCMVIQKDELAVWRLGVSWV